MKSQNESSAEDLLLDASDSELDLHGIIVSILRRKRIVIIATLVCALLAFWYVSRQPVTYQAHVELLPPASSRSTGVAALAGGGFTENGLNALGTAVQAKNQVDSFTIILQAWPLQDSMVKRFNLVKAYNAPNATVARYILASRVKITGTKEGFVIVDLIDTDRYRAAELANGYVDQARDFLRTLALSEASQRRAFYEGQLGATKDALSKAEDSFKRLQQSTGIITVDAQSQAAMSEVTSLRSQITAKEVELQALRSYSTAANPQVQLAESELGALQGKLSQIETRGEGGLTGKSLSSVPSAQLEFVRATRELKYQEGLYDLMVRQYEGSKLDEARDAPAIQVVEPALPPDGRFGPHRLKTTITGAGIGLLLGIAIALYLHWREDADEEKWAEVKRALHWRV